MQHVQFQQVNGRGRHVLASLSQGSPSLFQRLLRWRIRRHDARIQVFAAACAAAALRGDRIAAARFRADLDHATALRDGLLALRRCPPCDHLCDEGHDCPART